MKYGIVISVLVAFIFGILSSLVYIEYITAPDQDNNPTYTTYVLSNGLKTQEVQKSDMSDNKNSNVLVKLGLTNEEKPSPYNWISEGDIYVYEDRVVLNIKNAEWATFTDTNSMDPTFDYGSNAIEIVPETPNQIHVGDIVSYNLRGSDSIIIHRVIETAFDELGWYMKTKGDNNARADPDKIRFDQVKRIVVAIVY